MIDRARLAALLERERGVFAARNPRIAAPRTRAADHLFGGVPMTWMNKWAGGFPLYLAERAGPRVTDVDGHAYVDFCLGDTGAMAGHSPRADGRRRAAPLRRARRDDGDAADRGRAVGRRRADPPLRDAARGASR